LDIKCLFLSGWRQIRTAAMGHLGSHANALAKGWVSVNGFTNVHGICAHLNGKHNLSDHVPSVGAHDAAPQDASMAMSLRRIVKEQLRKALVATIGVCSA
jgi:hypothetical protein